MLSQQWASSSNLNYFNTPMKLEINPYTSLLTNYRLNNNNTINLTLYHRFVDGAADAVSTGLSNVSVISNLTAKKGGLYVNLINQSPTF